MDSLSETNGNFTFKLLKTLSENNSKNVLFSPVSLSSALAMVCLGAKGETAGQIAQALSLNSCNASGDAHQGFQLLLSELNKTGSEYELRIVNRLFGEKSYGFLSSFKDSCHEFYEAEMEELDFMGASEESRKHINTWVAKKTEDKIPELLSPGILDPSTTLVLVNAIYFKGGWKRRFNRRLTQPGIFHVSKNEKKFVQMMNEQSFFKWKYIEEISTEILVLPYVDEEVNMIIVLPGKDTDLRTVEKELTNEKFTEWMTMMDNDREQLVNVFLPRFKVENTYDMKGILGSLGVTDVFEPDRADLSGMSSRRDLALSQLVHTSFMNVNEEGTEMAAAAAARLLYGSAMVPWFQANRPFFFFIQHSKSKAILFCGRFSSP